MDGLREWCEHDRTTDLFTELAHKVQVRGQKNAAQESEDIIFKMSQQMQGILYQNLGEK
jgi:hypothetical protein